MPHVNSSGGGEDLASTDEVKVYDDEGEEEQRSSENLSEDKLGLVTETEEGKTSDIEGPNFAGSEKSGGPEGKTPEPVPDRLPGPFGYPFLTPYPFHNGAGLVSFPVGATI
ncbi:hypothetical protein CAPTEDRAFT_193320 [Capitella teleta]|uniref:Uncharacterized protein n=1 Tax=Capitella teleta TaxID=283909 RepID=R7V1E7_CAPTE|nr:hypothetical protein CAPTEDRAFT_193320 [Capitella teleta]|eukprot:ELU10027.1 hypothetical protein CAPTEDRAFT_193320 [Capitella teleta]